MFQDLSYGYTQEELNAMIENHEYESYEIDGSGNEFYIQRELVICSLGDIEELVVIRLKLLSIVKDQYWFKDDNGFIITEYYDLVEEDFRIPLQYLVNYIW